MFEQLGVIGCGLMGGSFALACKQAGLVKRVVGYSKSPSTTQRALQLGVIDIEAPSALMAVAGSDLVLLAVPVAATEATLKSIKALVGPDVLVMDVGSTKCDVVDAARRALREQVGSFIPAHPIAGKAMGGVDQADAQLYKGQPVIITPIEKTLTALLKRATQLWEALGADVYTMSPQAHDQTFAAVSHLPHLLSFAYMNGLTNQADGADHMALAGPGFRDFTRIAAGDPIVWRDIFLANRSALLLQLQQFQDQLNQLTTAIQAQDADAVAALIRQASVARQQWNAPGRDPAT